MTYSTCPSCGLRIGSRDGIGPTRCPRCLARRKLSIDLVRSVNREREVQQHVRTAHQSIQ